MNYEDLDPDTKGVITAMCDQTGKTKEKAILALIEFGMVSMIAAVSEPSDKQRLMNNIYQVVNKDDNLNKTAELYKSTWSV